MKQQIDLLMQFYTSNRLNFESLIRDAKCGNGIMPFVGEALTKRTFGSRNDFIVEIQNRTSGISCDKSYDLSSSTFLDILDKLVNIHKKGVIDQKLLSFYSDLKIDDNYIKNQAVSLIPYVNGRHCITANMDRLIDHAYIMAKKTPNVTHPFERKKLNAFVRGGMTSSQSNIVLKIHGDIMSDSAHRILTKDDYCRYYDENTEFYTTVSQWIQNYIMLFIGVDICKDEYLLDLLKRLRSSGTYHYAIIGCKDDANAKKSMFDKLAGINILPILYDEDKPEALEMLLHKFLIDTNSVPRFPLGEIDYKYSHQNLVGREAQIRQLVSFLNKDNRFLWTIISGERRTGRTKLAYEFSRIYASNWEWYILEPEEIDEFMNSQVRIQRERKRDRNLLITFDNFHWYNGSLDKIFNSEACMNIYSIKIRFIFIVHDIKQSTLWKVMSLSGCDELKKKISDSADMGISIKPLTVDQIMELCHGYIYYRSYQLGIETKIDTVFELIDDELKAFIEELHRLKEADILALSQLKAISLVNKNNGSPYLRDSELADKVFRLTITTENPLSDVIDFDYDKWFRDRNERNNNAVFIKEYFNNKEKRVDIEKLDYSEEHEMSRMIMNSMINDNVFDEKGDDKNEEK